MTLKQTALEWLEDNIQSDMEFMEVLELIRQAKEMEKEQIMKTPQEKAEDLYSKMDNVVGGGNYDAKQYVLIAVNEIIEIFNDTNGSDYRLNYWKEVKQEIQKL